MGKDFYAEPLEQSKIKGEIVSKYFLTWATIILKKTERICFVDLYSGPGRYQDGTDSTPLLILNRAIETPILSKSLICIFNDKDKKHIDLLKKNIDELDHVENLSSCPNFLNLEVSDAIVDHLKYLCNTPTFYFLDPWGYKGLSLELIKSSISSWGSECLFFFNYNRINPAVKNELVKKEMELLFGRERLQNLREKTKDVSPFEREVEIINGLCETLKELGGKYVLPFCFKHTEKEKTSHYLVFVGKHPLGFDLMKQIMAKYSEKDSDNIPSFTFDPKPKQQLEFTFNRPLKELADTLINTYEGNKILFKTLYNEHQQRTRFIKDNYKKALLLLEEKGIITIDIPRDKRIRNGKVTLGKNRTIDFPKKN